MVWLAGLAFDPVLHGQVQDRVEKHAYGDLEADAMLAPVREVLVLAPCEAGFRHSGNITTIM